MRPWWRRYIRYGVLYLLGGMTAGAVCFTTPKAALNAGMSGVWRPSEVDQAGYRLLSVYSDPLLGQRWARIGSCSHADWPPSSMELPGLFDRTEFNVKGSQPQQLVVHAGDPVRLWQQNEIVSMELRGVSEGAGAIGSRITVRIAAAGFSDGANYERRTGVVRGPDDVELLP